MRNIKLKNIIKRILRKSGIALHKEKKEKQNNISMLSDEKLISMIGMEMHCFYYPEGSGIRNFDYLENLIMEAERRNLSFYENIKGAKAFLEELKTRQKESTNEDVAVDFASIENFFELAKKRQSIRKFLKKKIPKEIIYRILQCAIETPSSCNRQTWRFLILNDKKSLSFISEIRRTAFLKDTSTVICILIDKDLYIDNKELDYTIYMDGAAAIMNIIYAAQSLGISSCWVNFGKLEISEANMNRFNRFFKVKPNFKPISLVALGYGIQNIKKPMRESIEYYLIDAKK